MGDVKLVVRKRNIYDLFLHTGPIFISTIDHYSNCEEIVFKVECINLEENNGTLDIDPRDSSQRFPILVS